ncbi:MAG: ATP-binding cassette domain-containing protein, partial [Candidatus Obscuribacterales bacterium]|nr:ATP-binding cassette domain-containing protein [Candidatus Obscuribacterales bacterium]
MVAEFLTVNIQLQIGSFHLAVDFSVPSGITVITGASGSGKSTVLNCLAGLRKPNKGIISCGEQVFFDSEKAVNVQPQGRNCGYVLQNLALFPNLNISQNICYGIDRQTKHEQQERLNKLLALVKLEGMEKREISALSGGQLQRVDLARALAPRPKLLLLD